MGIGDGDRGKAGSMGLRGVGRVPAIGRAKRSASVGGEIAAGDQEVDRAEHGKTSCKKVSTDYIQVSELRSGDDDVLDTMARLTSATDHIMSGAHSHNISRELESNMDA